MIKHPEGDCSRGWGKKLKKSDLTNGMTSKALVEDLNVLTGYYDNCHIYITSPFVYLLRLPPLY